MKHLKISILLLIIVSFLLFFCVKNSNSETQKDNNTNTYVIKNVNIIPMTENNSIIENATVGIHKNIIQSINDSILSEATIIDGKGNQIKTTPPIEGRQSVRNAKGLAL